MTESKIRVKHTKPFTAVFNSVIQDKRISLKTLGLFVVMQSFPDDWEYSISGLAARCRIGRDAVRKCLKELEEAGYLLKEQGHQENGKFACNTYVLQDEAPPCTEKPYTVKPSTVKPLTENQPQVKKHLSKETSSNPPYPQKEITDRIAEYAAGDQELEDAILGLVLNRREALGPKKAVKTLRTMNGILKDLDDLSNDDRQVKLMMLAKAVKNNWLTVYQLKPDEMPKGSREPFNEEGVDGI